MTAEALATLTDDPTPGWGQSLAYGAAGIALLHIQRARTGAAGWQRVHRLAVKMAQESVVAHPDHASLFHGAPAVAYALHTSGHPAYPSALVTLDTHIAALIRDRLDAAHRRIDAARLAQAREYDLINGLTGLGAYLLHRDTDHDLLRDVLAYLTRLTQPIRAGDEILPGWWATGSPDRHTSPRWVDGHAGFGMAHGITGPLALLSRAMTRGITVDSHTDAIHAICQWLDQWRTHRDDQTWWPEVINRDELHAQTPAHPGPHRPSWCYGTPGIARAQQLAALALDNPWRAHDAQRALIECLTDERQLTLITDASLCHGWAGLVHTGRQAASDTNSPELTAAVATATRRLREYIDHHAPPAGTGFLEGAAGIELVTMTADTDPPQTPPWDACLLVSRTPRT